MPGQNLESYFNKKYEIEAAAHYVAENVEIFFQEMRGSCG